MGLRAHARHDLETQCGARRDENDDSRLEESVGCVARDFSEFFLPTAPHLQNGTRLANACGLAFFCGFSTSACNGCTDDAESRSGESGLCNKKISRATNSCTRTRHRLGLKVPKITGKSRLAFNQINLFEPNLKICDFASFYLFTY